MPSSSASAAEPSDQNTHQPTDIQLKQVRCILDRYDLDADPTEAFTLAVQLSRHDALNAQYQAGYGREGTVKLLRDLAAAFGVAGPTVAFLLQPIPQVPPYSRYALTAFIVVGAVTYIYTSWTNRPRIPRTPAPDASGWLGVVGIPREERTPDRLVEHYVKRAVNPIAAYGEEVGDHGDVAHSRHRRNQHSSLGNTVLVLLGVLSVALLLLRL